MSDHPTRCPRSRIALGVALAGLLVWFTVDAHGQRRRVFLFDEGDFEPIGKVNRTGRLVALVGVGAPRPAQPGERIHLFVTVYQPATGAVAAGRHVTPNAQASRTTLAVALPGSAPFRPGLVHANAQASLVLRGRVIRTWSWTSRVVLQAR